MKGCASILKRQRRTSIRRKQLSVSLETAALKLEIQEVPTNGMPLHPFSRGADFEQVAVRHAREDPPKNGQPVKTRPGVTT